MIDAQFQGAEDRRLEVPLPGFLDRLGIDVAPRLLVAHAAAGKDGHLKIGASESAVLHRRIYMAGKACDNADRTRMSKALAVLLLGPAAIALWVGWGRTHHPPPLPPVAELPPPIFDPTDRVAVARLQHGTEIRDKYHAVAVDYPGEVFLRWFKREAALELWARSNSTRRFRLIWSYPILASSGEPGPKRREGDRQVPEGFYEVDRFNPQSAYHLSLGLNYPNAADRVLSDRDQPGSDIFIHGQDVSIGCAPIGDDGIEEVYLAALDAREAGQARIEVHIFPARMAGPEWDQFAAQEVAARPELGPFWAQLQPGFAFFQRDRQLPPITTSEDGRYFVPGP
jgi:murein L,D-transpeptidase YafK